MKTVVETNQAGERTQDEYHVIYLVTLNAPRDEGGYQYLTSDNTWSSEHDEGLAFRSEDSAHKVASELLTEGDIVVLCSARRGEVAFAEDSNTTTDKSAYTPTANDGSAWDGKINHVKQIEVKIFGANLRDQSKGAFVVHKSDCADCKKLEKLGENCSVEKHDSALSISKSIWSDMINEGSMTAEDGLQEIHFAPCVKFK